jgi:P27 family predicted phage terminase small subunit
MMPNPGKSENEKWLTGTRSTKPPMPRAPTNKPKMPPGMSDGAKAVWRRLLKQLPYATQADSDALGLLAMSLSIASQAAADIERDGVLRPDDRGRMAKNPAWQIYREANAAATKLLAAFGLTPESRQRMNLPEQKTDLRDLVNGLTYDDFREKRGKKVEED